MYRTTRDKGGKWRAIFPAQRSDIQVLLIRGKSRGKAHSAVEGDEGFLFDMYAPVTVHSHNYYPWFYGLLYGVLLLFEAYISRSCHSFYKLSSLAILISNLTKTNLQDYL